MIKEKILNRLYVRKKMSMAEISKFINVNIRQVDYWMKRYNIKSRSISEAIYQKHNKSGDPFKMAKFASNKNIFKNKTFLFGLGLGLYWGEGAKRNIHSVRLSNSDPALIKKFIDFLVEIYGIDKNRLRFQLQTYDDLDLKRLVSFWTKYLSVKNTQFYKTTILVRRGVGTYSEKMKNGVIIVYFNNMKLKNLISSQIANIGLM
jgi:hypothetical protein